MLSAFIALNLSQVRREAVESRKKRRKNRKPLEKQLLVQFLSYNHRGYNVAYVL